MYEDVPDLIDTKHRRVNDLHNAATNVIESTYIVRVFVLLFECTRLKHEPSFLWCGPRRIAAVTSPVVCTVEIVLTGKKILIMPPP